MTRKSKLFVATLAALAVAGTACGDDSKKPENGGEGGSGGSGGTGPLPEGPALGARDQIGAQLLAQPRSVLVGDQQVIVGTRGVSTDASYFGAYKAPYDPEAEQQEAPPYVIVAGLGAIDRHTGAMKVYGADDGFPTIHYADPFNDYGDAAASVFDLEWLSKDESFVGAAWNYLVKGTRAEDGSWTFIKATFRAEGEAQDSLVTHVEVIDGKVIVGGDQGVAVVDPSDLHVERWIDMSAVAPGGVATWKMDAGLFQDESVVALVHSTPDKSFPTNLSIIHLDDGAVDSVALPQGVLPLSTVVFNPRVLVGVRTPDKRGAIYSWEERDGAFELVQAAGALDLTTPGRGAVVPGEMAFDSYHSELIVGGTVVDRSPGGPGGGIVRLSTNVVGDIGGGRAVDLLPRQDPWFNLLPWQVDGMNVDEKGNLWLLGSTLCNENKNKQMPVLKIERDDDRRVSAVVRPWISGVQSVTVDPVEGATWLGLRDEVPGLSCDGLAVGQELCRLRGDGSCEIYTPRVNANADMFASDPGVVELAFGDAARKEMALATNRDAFFFRTGDVTRALPTQFDPGLNLHMTGVAFGAPGQLWISSIMEVDTMYPQVVNDRGPHGLGLLILDEAGETTELRRYVRNASDSKSYDVAGLSSNMVWDVLPLDGDKRVLAALGLERDSMSYDHLLGEPVLDNGSKGGVALIEDRTITNIAFPDGADIVALAKGADGVIYALDANAGIFTVDLEAKSATLWAANAWTPETRKPERAISLAVAADGHVAVGTTHGLYVYGANKGVTTALEGMASGYSWALRFDDEHHVLVAGTDHGLVRIALGEGELPAAGPERFASRELWPLPERTVGVGGSCVLDSQCLDGSSCACDVTFTNCACTEIDACAAQPGGEGCSCNPGVSDPCAGQTLVCVTDDSGKGSCQAPVVDCGGVAGCRCHEDVDCADGFYCNFSGPVATCAEAPLDPCQLDCSCSMEGSTADGCLDGYFCQRMGMGQQTCMEIPCEETCSCTGEGTVEGCPEGMECVVDGDARYCDGGVVIGPHI